MSVGEAFQGNLFSGDLLAESIVRSADWLALDDHHVVRRTVLERCVYGADKKPMAVELAKVSLWLHTFTVGAPLGFLDHHLRCGDSLFGCWVRKGIDRAEGTDSTTISLFKSGCSATR